MSFIPIALEKFIKIYLKQNPLIAENVLRIKLESAIEAYKNGEKCSCGNDIWVVGTANDGFKCFQCITKKKHPAGDYEIEPAIDKVDKFGRRHIDEMDPRKIAGMFDDDGYEIIPDSISKPPLCITCLKNHDPGPEDDLLCNLTRYDQRLSNEFICHEYSKL